MQSLTRTPATVYNLTGETGQAALAYASRGVPVFPCKPGGKAPLTHHGHLDATVDPEQIRKWWTRWPSANIGIPTGERSGLLVLDIDPDKGGDASLATLVSEHGPLPTTTTVKTGSGGRHIYLRYPTGSGISNSAGKLGPGLDVRGEGGYVIAPPSYTTGPYTTLHKAPLAVPQEWLLEALRNDPRGSAPTPRQRTDPQRERDDPRGRA